MSSPAAQLRSLLARGRIVVAPGVHDGFSAKITRYLGFEALYVSGAQCNYAHGFPDLAIRSMAEMCADIDEIASAVDIPVIADAGTGYGNPVNVHRTIVAFERAGVAALHIDDRPFEQDPSGAPIIPVAEMVAKIQAAVDARRDEATVVIAKTEAAPLEGLERAVDRMRLYLEAGADAAFVARAGAEAYPRLPKEVAAPNIVLITGAPEEHGLTVGQLDAWGFAICALSVAPLLWAAQTAVDRLRDFKVSGQIERLRDHQLDKRTLDEVLQADFWLALESPASR